MWVKLDDHFVEHPKLVAAGPLAGWLYVAALCYCNRWLTNGFVAANQVDRLMPANGVGTAALGKLVNKLCVVGLWKPTEQKGTKGYLIHDFLHYQPSRHQVLRERKKTAERQGRWRRKVTVNNHRE